MTFVGAEERALWVAAAVRALPRIVPTEPPYSDAVRDGVIRPYNGALS